MCIYNAKVVSWLWVSSPNVFTSSFRCSHPSQLPPPPLGRIMLPSTPPRGSCLPSHSLWHSEHYISIKTYLQRIKRKELISVALGLPLEKEMATHPSTLAWRIPRTEKPGRLQSTGLQRVGHDWMTSLSLSHIYLCIYVCIYEKGMTSHPSILAWRIPWAEEISGL